MYTATGTYSINPIFFGEPREKTDTQAKKRLNAYGFGFNGQEKDNEVSGLGNTSYLGLREYDTRLGRMFSIDPRTPEYPWQSPYVYHRNSPIAFIDYLGGGDSDHEFDKDGNLISDLGGEDINFYHQEDGTVTIEDQHNCSTNTIKDGASLINYTHRNNNTNFMTLYWEWEYGNGPTKSLFHDFNNGNTEFFGSMNLYNSTYASKAREMVLFDGQLKGRMTFDYSETNPFTAGSRGWEQFLGRASLSYYKLDDKVVFILTDSKSMTSFFYRAWPFGNHERGDWFWGNHNGNTYQTYIWTESISEISEKYQKLIEAQTKNVDPIYNKD